MAKNYDDKSETKHFMGEILGAGVLIMSQHIGSAKTSTHEYLVGSSMNGAPIVESALTGKRYVFSWQALIDYAVTEGKIDEA